MPKRRRRNPKTMAEVVNILYRMYLGKGKTPQQAMDMAQKNAPIYHAAVVAKEAYEAGASKETALRKALGSRGLKAVKSGELTAAHLRKIRTGENPMMYGTSYFTSKGAAVRYYKDYEGDIQSAREAVERKLAGGEIHIGKPPLKPGQRLSTTDGGKRYMIVEGNPRRSPYAIPRGAVYEYTVMLYAKHSPKNIPVRTYATTASKASAVVKKHRWEYIPTGDDPKKWKVLSVKRGPMFSQNSAKPVKVKMNGGTVPAKMKMVDGKVKIFVTPQVARKVNHEFHIDVDSHNAGRNIKGNPVTDRPYLALWKKSEYHNYSPWTKDGKRAFSIGQLTKSILRRGMNPDTPQSNLGQKAFEAGKRWAMYGAHESGVANARVVRYGFSKWWNNFSPAETRGVKKSLLERDFREGYKVWKGR